MDIARIILKPPRIFGRVLSQKHVCVTGAGRELQSAGCNMNYATIRHLLYALWIGIDLVLFCAGGMRVNAASLRIVVAPPSVSEGGTLVIRVSLAQPESRPVDGHSGLQLWPYVNGRQWGAPARLDKRGRAEMMVPLPNPGMARIQVAARIPLRVPAADWIWSHKLANRQTVYFQRGFHLDGVAKRAGMLITCDDLFTAWLNGHQIGTGDNLQQVEHFQKLGRFLKSGENILSVRAYNGTGAAGLLARVTVHTAAGVKAIITDGSWHCFAAKPTGWLTAAGSSEHAERVRVIAPVGGGVWGRTIRGWPGIRQRAVFPVGRPLPPDALVSNTVSVHVAARQFSVSAHRRHLVGMEYEPWFTPLNATWSTAEAIPLLGKYSSFNPAVIRQHALWLDQMGINYILIDWSNNLWGKTHFNQCPPGARQIIHATTVLLQTYAQMRREGIPTPRITLLLGLINGPPTTTTAVNEEMQWVRKHYIKNPKFKGLWLNYRKKPLIVIFNGAGPGYMAGKPPINHRYFTVRWMSSQFQNNPQLARAGYWSWMDGSITPVPTYNRGQCEALTITPAFFGNGGWLRPQARARLNGTTYLREFDTALKYHPHFLTICQWNEFAGQSIGHGYGPKHNVYVDCYNLHLNNDIEPTSPTDCAYRGCGGWGFYYLNLTRAMINLYHQKQPRTTILAIGEPGREQVIHSRSMPVRWACIGKQPGSFTLKLDGKVIVRHIPSARRSYTIRLPHLVPGRHSLVLQAIGGWSRFRLSYVREARRLPHLVPAEAKEAFVFSSSDR